MINNELIIDNFAGGGGASTGIEEFGENHKPSPFIITCKCGGRAMDISGIRKLPEGYQPLPSGASYFANRKKRIAVYQF